MYMYIYLCIYVCKYICMHVHICVYIFCAFVDLYILVYNWFKSGQWRLLKDTLLIGLFQKKIRDSRRGLDYIFEKTMEFLGLSLYLRKLWIPEKKTVRPRNFLEIVVHSFIGLKISTRLKTKTHGNYTLFFLDQLITPRNFTSLLIDPWNFLMLFHFFNIPTPGICVSSTPFPCWPPPTCFWIFLE